VKTLTLLLLAAAAWARSGLSPEDWWQLREASDARIRGDGAWIVYVESWNDGASDAPFSNLWLAAAEGKVRRPWTRGNWRDWSPRWSSDGSRIAWLSKRGGRTAIHVRGWGQADDAVLETGEEEPLALAWSAEGDAIAYLARVKTGAQAAAWAPADLLPYLRRDGTATEIFRIAVTGGGKARAVAAGNLNCGGEPAWALDGQALVAACGDGIYRLPISGGAAKLLTAEEGRYESPVVSPDGGRIAYLFTSRKAQSYTVRKLVVMRTDGSGQKILSGALDRDAASPQWSPESRTVYFLADDRGATHVYAAHNDGTVRQATAAAERLYGLSLADNGRAASVRWRAAEAGNVVSFAVDVEPEPQVAAAPNEGLLAGRELAGAEEMEFGSDGHTIQAWLIRPVPFEAAHKYPLLVDVADDPRRMYGVEFEARAQMLAAAGYAVLHVNPRGTPGYGEEFGALLRTRYPGDDFDDLMRGVDAAVGRGWVDGDRVYIAGGLLAAWAMGHTNRFRGAIARHPVMDWTADVALRADGTRRAAEWMEAMPWEDAEQYVKHSPIYFAGKFRTPALILAGKEDAESEELYFALRARQVEVEMVRLPEKPGARVLEMKAMVGWMGR
jgi:dipeptidyl aminopeptidase/acylaminoacyl peptidase